MGKRRRAAEYWPPPQKCAIIRSWVHLPCVLGQLPRSGIRLSVRAQSEERLHLRFQQANMNDTFERLSEVFRTVFDEEGLMVSRETSAKDIPQWDSLMHVSLIINVEKAFGVRFLSSEVAGLQNLGELADLIEAKRRS